MSKPAAESLQPTQASPWWRQAALGVSATFFIALCARVTVPLPFTPVPLTLQNFAVLLVGLVLGSAGGFAALLLYLAEGLMGLPVFNPTGPGGLGQLLGPTGGYLMAYPVIAFVSGWIFERGGRTFRRAVFAALVGEVVLFAGGVGWLALVLRGSWVQAAPFGLYPFVFAELAKIMAAAGLATRLPGIRRLRSSRSTE
jgi:biotin transport system substrate-specific component